MVQAILEQVTGQAMADLVRELLVKPMGLREPKYVRGSVWLRTDDMAKLGQLLLQNGRWQDQQLLPAAFVTDMLKPHSAGGPPVGLPYGLSWWVGPSPTYIASGYAGQFIWVHPPLGVVVAINATVSAPSQARGQATQIIRGRLFQAVQKRVTTRGS